MAGKHEIFQKMAFEKPFGMLQIAHNIEGEEEWRGSYCSSFPILQITKNEYWAVQ